MTYNQKAAIRITIITLCVSMFFGTMSWFFAKEKAEENAVAIATEESQRLIQHFTTSEQGIVLTRQTAKIAADAIIGGLFDIAEIYSSSGDKLAEALTEKGELIEDQLPKHISPDYDKNHYESFYTTEDEWVLRIFVPLYTSAQEIEQIGYFEGVRVVSSWEVSSIQMTAFFSAIMASLASILCGIAIYPIVILLSKEVHKKNASLMNANISMMRALGRVIEKRDSDTGAHNYRVTWIAIRIAETIHHPINQIHGLIVGSFLHDIGKVAIPDAILHKPGRLTDDEMVIMKTHVDQGGDIVNNIEWLKGAKEVITGHHEKWDGNGYPKALSEHNIPINARIFAISDVFDALCSKRPYKDPIPYEQVINILKEGHGSHFDPMLLDAFFTVAKEVYQFFEEASEDELEKKIEAKIRQYLDASTL